MLLQELVKERIAHYGTSTYKVDSHEDVFKG